MRESSWSCCSQCPDDCCCRLFGCWLFGCCSLAVVCGAFNAFRIYLWPLDARNSTIPFPMSHVLATSSVRPFHQKARKARESENTKDKNIPAMRKDIHWASHANISHFHKRANLSGTSLRFFPALLWFLPLWMDCVFWGSQGTQKIRRLQSYIFLSADLNKLQFGQLKGKEWPKFVVCILCCKVKKFLTTIEKFIPHKSEKNE